MGILEQTVIKTKSAAKAAGKMANDIFEAAKLKIAVADLTSEIEQIYKEIGEAVYLAYKGNADPGSFSEKCALIAERKASIADLVEQINTLKKMIACPSCNVANPIDNDFCFKCGSKLSSEDKEPVSYPLTNEEEDIYEDLPLTEGE